MGVEMRFRFQDERGATAIEYALIAGLIALGLVGSLVRTRGSLSATYGQASASLSPATADQTPDFSKKTLSKTTYITNGTTASAFYQRTVTSYFEDGSYVVKSYYMRYDTEDDVVNYGFYDTVGKTYHEYVINNVTNSLLAVKISDYDSRSMKKYYTTENNIMYTYPGGSIAPVTRDVLDLIPLSPGEVSSVSKYMTWKDPT